MKFVQYFVLSVVIFVEAARGCRLTRHLIQLADFTFSPLWNKCPDDHRAFVSFSGKELYAVRRLLYVFWQCTWGLPQTLLGLVVWLFHRNSGHCCFHSAVVSEWKHASGVSLGLFLFVEKGCLGCRPFLVHEYGHALQSLVLGPLYLPVVAIPSALWFSLPCLRRYREKQGISYYAFYTERWADAWGEWFCREMPAERECKRD